MKMENNNPLFGWSSVFSIYGIKDFLKDSLWPVALSIILTSLSYFTESDVYDIIGVVFSIGISIIPVVLSLLIAAYAIVLSMFFSNKANFFTEDEYGRHLLSLINADFAMSIFVSLSSFVVLFVGNFIYKLSLTFVYGFYVNILVLFGIIYLIFFCFFILKDLVIGLYNVAQATINLPT